MVWWQSAVFCATQLPGCGYQYVPFVFKAVTLRLLFLFAKTSLVLGKGESGGTKSEGEGENEIFMSVCR